MKYSLKQRGIGLLELMLALAIIAILLVMALRYFGVTNRSQELNQAHSDVTVLIGSVQNWKTGKADYAGLTTEALSNAGLLPDDITQDGGQFQLQSWDSCRGTLEVAASNNSQATITFAGVSSQICSGLATRMQVSQDGTSNLSTFISSSECTGAQSSGCAATYTLTLN